MPDKKTVGPRASRIIPFRALAKVVKENTDDAQVIEEARPKTRAECIEGQRPCPFVSCRHHLYLDVTRAGSLQLNFPDKEVWEMTESCALDVAERGPSSLEDVGAMMQLTKERVRQLEVDALHSMARSFREPSRRRLPLLG